MADKKGGSIIIIKKKSGGHGGHHGGAWKVAYADFVTAMMCFFLVMWLMGSDEETKAMVSHYFNHPTTPWQNGRDPDSKDIHPLGEQQGAGDSLLQGRDGGLPDELVEVPKRPQVRNEVDYEQIAQTLKSVFEGRVYGVDLTKDYLRFSIPEDALFERNSVSFKRVTPSFLDRLGRILKPWKGLVTIEGHVDNNPESRGGFGSSYEFTLARAVALMRYLVDKRWVSEEQILPVGAGPRRSFSTNETEFGRDKNRRVDFLLTAN